MPLGGQESSGKHRHKFSLSNDYSIEKGAPQLGIRAMGLQ